MSPKKNFWKSQKSKFYQKSKLKKFEKNELSREDPGLKIKILASRGNLIVGQYKKIQIPTPKKLGEEGDFSEILFFATAVLLLLAHGCPKL